MLPELSGDSRIKGKFGESSIGFKSPSGCPRRKTLSQAGCHSSYLTNGFLNICISQVQRKKLCLKVAVARARSWLRCAKHGATLLGSMVPPGIHGDGVPIQGRMNQSTLDVWCLNLPCSEHFQAERIPICCLETRYNAGPETCEAICEVIAWSLKELGEGNFPSERHDGQPFSSLKDKRRKAMAGEAMPAKAT